MKKSLPAFGVLGVAFVAAGVLSGESWRSERTSEARGDGALIARPDGMELSGWRPHATRSTPDLTPGRVARTTARPTVVDTRAFPEQIQHRVLTPEQRVARSGVMPEHEKMEMGHRDGGGRASVATGGVGGAAEIAMGRSFNTIGFTGVAPPDPTLAVGPNHVLVTVNQDIAWYTKDGVEEFSAPFGNNGSPGFFENEGALDFVFDPKCAYDHHAQRYLVLALEVYGTGTTTTADDEAAIVLAISDDDDPNGVWYKYRFDALVTVNGEVFWWDYPGLGFDADAVYLTGNLFNINPAGSQGAAGTAFQIIDKSSLLSGGAMVSTSLSDGRYQTTQGAHHFGTNPAAYFATIRFFGFITLVAVRDPLTSPTIVLADLPVDSFGYPVSATTPSGTVSAVDLRLFNSQWRDGKLVCGHAITTSASPSNNVARWYEFETNGWPVTPSAQPTLAQTGELTDVANDHVFFPALYSDGEGAIGIVTAASSATHQPLVMVSGRRLTDPAGEMSPLVESAASTGGATGRWGDYFGMAQDPTNPRVLWAIGEIQTGSGWNDSVREFSVTDAIGALSPDGGETLTLGSPVTISWDGAPGGSFEVQETSNFGDITTTNDGFESGAIGPEYTNASASPWAVQSSVVHSGSFAARSAPSGVNQASVLSRTFQGPADLSCWYRTDISGGIGTFRIAIDGDNVASENASAPWTEMVASVGPGMHTITWTMTHQFGTGTTAATIDDLEIVSDTTLWNDVTPAARADQLTWTPTQATTAGKVRVREVIAPSVKTGWVESATTFTVVPPVTCPGDITGDGATDVFDFTVFAANFGHAVPAGTDGDLDADGDVDVFDFALFAADFGCMP